MIERIPRYNGRTILGALFASLVMIATHARGDQPVDIAGLSLAEQQLLQEYRSNYERLKEFYNNIRIEVIHRRTSYPDDPGEGKPERTAEYLVYRANGDDLARMDISPLGVEDDSPVGETSVELIRPKEGVLGAKRETPESPFVLGMVHPQYDKGFLMSYKFYAAPYTVFPFPMEYWLSALSENMRP